MVKYLTNLFFVLYFVILFGERVQSIIRSYVNKSYINDGLTVYMYVLTVVSIVATTVFLLIRQRDMFVGLFTMDEAHHNAIDYEMLCIAAGCMLFSGMVHTDYSIPGIQFLSYGSLVAAMALRTSEMAGTGNRYGMWMSFAYVVAFSMAIPVVYRSNIQHKDLFHVLEIIVSAVTIIAFTMMLREIFTGNGVGIFNFIFIIVAAVGDGIILAMRWKEHVNVFVLVFIVLATVLFAIGKATVRT